jgi:hypothetical protein
MFVLLLIKALVIQVVENMNAGHMGPGAPGIDKAVLMLDFGEFSDLGDGDDDLTARPSSNYKGSVAELMQQVAALEKCVLQESAYYRNRHLADIADMKMVFRQALKRHAVHLSEPQKAHLKRQREKSGIKLRIDGKKPAKPLNW